jgi:hypothetical protein
VNSKEVWTEHQLEFRERDVDVETPEHGMYDRQTSARLEGPDLSKLEEHDAAATRASRDAQDGLAPATSLYRQRGMRGSPFYALVVAEEGQRTSPPVVASSDGSRGVKTRCARPSKSTLAETK